MHLLYCSPYLFKKRKEKKDEYVVQDTIGFRQFLAMVTKLPPLHLVLVDGCSVV